MVLPKEALMSAVGQKLPHDLIRGAFALPPKADIRSAFRQILN
jgi:hypothetical protein